MSSSSGKCIPGLDLETCGGRTVLCFTARRKSSKGKWNWKPENTQNTIQFLQYPVHVCCDLSYYSASQNMWMLCVCPQRCAFKQVICTSVLIWHQPLQICIWGVASVSTSVHGASSIRHTGLPVRFSLPFSLQGWCAMDLWIHGRTFCPLVASRGQKLKQQPQRPCKCCLKAPFWQRLSFQAGRASMVCCLLILPPDLAAALMNSFLCVEETGKQNRAFVKALKKKIIKKESQWPCTIFHMPPYQSHMSCPHKLEK